jgi:YebC/PmpR family DNA-binding regulatory protein
MSGHNKWSSIKHKKGKADALRGRLFSRLVKEITVSTREGGSSPDSNARLRVAIETAKAQNMPSDNIDRAIKRGTGELDGVTYEEINYEAYGPGGVAVLIEVLTDNKNRAAAEVRHMLTRFGGRLGTRNSVSYLFTRIGQITLDGSKYTEDSVLEAGLECGVEDVQTSDGIIVATTNATRVFEVSDALKAAGLEIESAEVVKVPETWVQLSEKESGKALALLEALEENDDVQAVYTNFEMQDG